MPRKPSTVKKVTPLRAIRLFCIYCCGDSTAEVRACGSTDCILYPFRMGHSPKAEGTKTTTKPKTTKTKTKK